MYGPVLKGKLVTLRPPRTEDAEAMTRWFEDLEVIRFLNIQHQPSLEMEKEWIESNAKDPSTIVWVVEVDGRAVGSTGIRGVDWKQGHGTTGTVISDKTLWGKGIGRELMRLRADYLFTHTPLRKLKSAYMEGNVASGRAQASAGYREIGRARAEQWADGGWRDLILTELMREDWEKARRKSV
ncbi:MAG TPA: GNAT family protein [Candidatus Dormibacteraeota bacterium]|nr:GNAT family protein [Candidatus Dormibacteraeota bacterium]